MLAAPVRSRYWLVVVPAVGGVVGAIAAALVQLPSDWILAGLVVLTVSPLLLLARNADRVILPLLLLDMAVPLDISFGYREDAADYSALAGLPISLTTLLLGAAYFHWVVARAAGTKPADAGWLRAVAPLGIYFGAVLASWPTALDAQLAGFEVGLAIQMLLLFGYLVHVIRRESDLLFVARVVVAVLLLEALIMAGVLLLGSSVRFGPILARVDTEPFFRVGGTVGAPNAAGAFLVLMALVTLGTWIAARRRFEAAVAVGTLGLAVVMLVFTLSRGAWLGLGVGGLVFMIVASARGWLSRRFLITATLLGLAIAAVVAGPIVERLFGGEASPIASRTALTEVGVEMFLDRPVLGVGANSFVAALPDHLGARFGGDFVNVVHNKYVLVAAETGILGLLAFLLFLGATLVRGWRALRVASPRLGPIILGFLAGFVGVMVHMYFDIFHGRTDTQMFITFAAVLTAAWRLGLGKGTESGRPRSDVPSSGAVPKGVSAE